MKYKMLVVEDDGQIREIIEDYFTSKKKTNSKYLSQKTVSKTKK